uniref:Uncharacterized protein n=1 Tax=viral metagenome TaxID=1070528 RepID=A0A6M3XLA4_9ZZZZ
MSDKNPGVPQKKEITIGIDFDQVLIDIETGEEINEERKKTVEGAEITEKFPFTLRTASVKALLAKDQAPEIALNLVLRFRLAKRIHESPSPITLSKPEIDLLKARIAGVFPPLISGQAVDMLSLE